MNETLVIILEILFFVGLGSAYYFWQRRRVIHHYKSVIYSDLLDLKELLNDSPLSNTIERDFSAFENYSKTHLLKLIPSLTLEAKKNTNNQVTGLLNNLIEQINGLPGK